MALTTTDPSLPQCANERAYQMTCGRLSHRTTCERQRARDRSPSRSCIRGTRDSARHRAPASAIARRGGAALLVMTAGRRPTQQRAREPGGAPGLLLYREAGASPCAPGRRPLRARERRPRRRLLAWASGALRGVGRRREDIDFRGGQDPSANSGSRASPSPATAATGESRRPPPACSGLLDDL